MARHVFHRSDPLVPTILVVLSITVPTTLFHGERATHLVRHFKRWTPFSRSESTEHGYPACHTWPLLVFTWASSAPCCDLYKLPTLMLLLA